MKLWDWVFPRRCVGCGRWGEYVCAGCVNGLRRVEKMICPMCGKGSMFGRTHGYCLRRSGMEGMVAVFAYRGLARRLVGKLKYKRVRDVCPTLVEAMVSVGEFAALEKGKFVVVPLPLHQRRLRERGFNQARELAVMLGEYFGWPVEAGLLVRKRWTKPQMTLKRKERLTNVQGAFTLNSNVKNPDYAKTTTGEQMSKLSGRSFLLVDDVWTTGATMREAAKVLKGAGARRVWGLVVAA